MYERYIKRILDFVLSLLALILLSPLLLVLALVVKIDSPGPAIFSQRRYGRRKKLFTIYKFRTMASNTPGDVPTNDLHGAQNYITRSGEFLRKTSLDELPQLFNILKGDMSIIGPRPALWNQYSLMEWRDKLGASDARPGLSGWAQVNGRDELSADDEKKARKDAEYTANISFAFDMKCLLMTFLKVASRDGLQEGDGKEGKS